MVTFTPYSEVYGTVFRVFRIVIGNVVFKNVKILNYYPELLKHAYSAYYMCKHDSKIYVAKTATTCPVSMN